MWRRLVALAHPDAGGDHELFIWTGTLRDVVCNSKTATSRQFAEDTEPTVHPSRQRQASTFSTADRVSFDQFADFEVLTDRAVTMAAAVAEPFGYLLRHVVDCYPVSSEAGPLYDQQLCGASYKSLAAVGHSVAMTKAERVQWYRIAEAIPLSQRHAGHIFSRLKRRAA